MIFPLLYLLHNNLKYILTTLMNQLVGMQKSNSTDLSLESIFLNRVDRLQWLKPYFLGTKILLQLRKILKV
jgi:hypothetical protein